MVREQRSFDRLHIDLAAARRAQRAMTDPLSLSTINDYISELEEQLRRDRGLIRTTLTDGPSAAVDRR